MRKTIILGIMMMLCGMAAVAQSKPAVSVLGDSYSTFEGWMTPDTCPSWYVAKNPNTRRTDVKSVRETWWWQLIKRKGWKLEANNSYSGSTICNTGYNDENRTHMSFVTRMHNLGSPDIILIFGGTNDAWANSPMGDYKYKDWRTADLFFFRPAMAYMLDKMQELYPTADIYFISNDGLKESVTSSVHEICRHYGVPVIQLKDIDKKSGHPSVKGMGQIAEQVAAAVRP